MTNHDELCDELENQIMEAVRDALSPFSRLSKYYWKNTYGNKVLRQVVNDLIKKFAKKIKRKR